MIPKIRGQSLTYKPTT